MVPDVAKDDLPVHPVLARPQRLLEGVDVDRNRVVEVAGEPIGLSRASNIMIIDWIVTKRRHNMGMELVY